MQSIAEESSLAINALLNPAEAKLMNFPSNVINKN
jgi:hypothetical protein